MINPPTDSLYKFIAITGIIMVLWGGAFPLKTFFEYRIKSEEIKGKINTTLSLSKKLKTEYDELTQQRELLSAGNAESKRKLNKIIIKQTYISFQVEKEKTSLDLEIEKGVIMGEAQNTYFNIGMGSIVIGIVFTVVGFLCWYFKLQRYLDKQVRVSLNSLDSE